MSPHRRRASDARVDDVAAVNSPPWGRRRRDRLPLLLLAALALVDVGWAVYLFTQPGPPFEQSPAWHLALRLFDGHLVVLGALLMGAAVLIPSQFGRRAKLERKAFAGLLAGALGHAMLTATFVAGALAQGGLGAGVATSAFVVAALHAGVLFLERR